MRTDIIDYIMSHPFKSDFSPGLHTKDVESRVTNEDDSADYMYKVYYDKLSFQRTMNFARLIYEIETDDPIYYEKLVDRFGEYFV